MNSDINMQERPDRSGPQDDGQSKDGQALRTTEVHYSTAEDAPEPDGLIERERLLEIIQQPARLTWWFVGTNIGLWVLAWLVGLIYMTEGFDGAGLGLSAKRLGLEGLAFYTGMKVDRLIADGQWWRLVSSMFVHLSILHIGFNAYGLYVLGPIFERFYGMRRMLLLYLGSGIIATAASFFFNDSPAGGASGAIYGLVGGVVVFGFKYRAYLPKRLSHALTVGLLPWVAIGIAIGFMESVPFDNAAHLGGLFSGGFLALVLGSKLREPRFRRWGHWAVSVFFVLGLAVLALSAWQWAVEVARCLPSATAYLGCYPELIPIVR